MSQQSGNTQGGIGFCGLLTIVLITLKLCKVIDWSWWWVFSPLWIPLAIILSILGVVLIAMGVLTMLDKARSR